MKLKKYAAIDIGSNAIRLLITNVIITKYDEPKYRKVSLIRLPIRLGEDVFTKGKISNGNQQRMIDAMNAYQLLMNVHQITKYKACATSAMREAKNGRAVVELIQKKTGIEIDIINGETEAKIISSTYLSSLLQSDNSYLYIDVGGGSTELTFFTEGKVVASKSYKLGTVRLLDKTKNKATFKSMEKWIKRHSKPLSRLSLIGSGGNINTIFKRSGTSLGKPLSYIYLNAHYKFLKEMTYEQRISELSLNPDRADVIIPATKIYLSAMKWSGARKIYVPKIGLADGIIKSLHLGKI
ncbi:MAG: exopolyphosphatase [Flavobacteriaceae bacterium]|nr:exopolyphosphatase [Flavobacteriaceae bacterium]